MDDKQTETPETPEEPQPQRVSLAGYIHSVAALVADVHKQHKIPHGTAFQIVAWGTTHLESKAMPSEADTLLTPEGGDQ